MIILLLDAMEYWQRFARRVEKKLSETHKLDTSDSNEWKLYRISGFVLDMLPSKEEIIRAEVSFNKHRTAIYLYPEYFHVRDVVEREFIKFFGTECPYFKEFNDRKELYHK
jgi:hypothetical protein